MKTAEKIMLSKTSLECKENGMEVHGYKEEVWKKNAKEICSPGILAKFQQNPHLANMLKRTGWADLVESSYDNIWVTGIPLKDPEYLDRKHWNSTGLLGEMLMDARRRLQNESVPQPMMTDTSNTMRGNEDNEVTVTQSGATTMHGNT